MATEGWLTIPGVGRRYRTRSGELRISPPNLFTPVRDFLGGIGPGIANFFNTQSQIPASGFPSRERRRDLTGIQTGKYGPSDWQVPGWKPAPGRPEPLTTGLDSSGRVDPTQSDQYKAAMGQRGPAAPAYPSFPQTPQGQFERYFSSGSPEMDRYFGAASRGAGAPKSLEEMNALASQSRAPMTSPLATYYRAQSAAGRGNMDEIISALGYTGAMAEWAKANPRIAQSEYNKKFPGGRSASPFETGAISKLNVPVGAAFANEPLSQGSGTQQEPAAMNPAFASQDLLRGANPYEMSALTGQQPSGASQGMDISQLYGKGAPNLAAYTLLGGAFNQGTQVSAPYQQAAQMAFQRTNPENFAELTQLQQSDNDLQRRIVLFLSGRAAQ